MFIHLIKTINQKQKMKKVFLFVGIAAFLMACNSQSASTEAGKAQEVAEATGAETFTVNSAESTVNWKGSKITGYSHTGTISVTGGSINADADAITAGSFELDMTSIASTDGMDEEMTGKLLGHLGSPDFFDTGNNPTAMFEVSAATADNLTGNLTIKGISKSITIPYTLNISEGTASAASSFSIDRSQWDVKYGSSSFFDDLGDNVINDAIEFNVNLVASK